MGTGRLRRNTWINRRAWRRAGLDTAYQIRYSYVSLADCYYPAQDLRESSLLSSKRLEFVVGCEEHRAH